MGQELSKSVKNYSCEIYCEFLSKLNSKDLSIEKIAELKELAIQIGNRDIKKIILIDKLFSDNYLSKIIAIAVLANQFIDDDEVRYFLMKNLEDNAHPSIKRSVIDVIIPYINKYPEIETTIVKLVTSNTETPALKKVLIKALAPRLLKPKIREVIISKLNDEISSIRVSVIECLAFYADNAEILEAILNKLNDNDTPVKIAAIKALSDKVNIDIVKKALIKKLDDINEFQIIKECCIEVLAQAIKDNADIKNKFIEIFFSDINSSVRNYAKNALLLNIQISELQEIICAKLVVEKSKVNMQNNIKNKFKKITDNLEEEDYLSAVL